MNNMAVDFVFLDSGTGGIPYMNYLLEKCPKADCVYVGDNANFPYGKKSHEEVVQCVLSVVDKIISEFNPKVIVIACNTMSVNALSVLRDAYPKIQFVGTVPAIKLAASVSKKRCFGLLATQSTVDNPYNTDLKNHFAADCRMVLRADADLIDFIEHKSFTATDEEKIDAIKPCVEFFKKEGCDAVILGCTHFLNMADLIQKVCGDEIKVVDSKEGVVNHALDVWGRCGGESPAGKGGEQRSASQGKAFPSHPYKDVRLRERYNGGKAFISHLYKDVRSQPLLFVTGFSDKKDEKEYDVICERYGYKFAGLLK